MNKISFRYKAADSKGNPVEGIIEAIDKDDALKKIQTLNEIGLSEISIEGLEAELLSAAKKSETKSKLVYWSAPKSFGDAVGQIIGAVLIGWLLISLSRCNAKQSELKPQPNQAVPFANSSDRNPAYFACKDYLLSKVFPSIATSAIKFQGVSSSPYTVLAGDKIKFESVVDAPNFFGAPIRHPFICIAQRQGGQWKVTDYSIESPSIE